MRSEAQTKHILYLCDADTGGIAEYAIRQVAALADAGARVTFLCRPGFPQERLRAHEVIAGLPSNPSAGQIWRKFMDRILDGRQIAKASCTVAREARADALLIACYSEYFSPFWAPFYRRLAKTGITIGTIAHDPVRDYVLGPGWWHRWSVREGFSFVRHVFVHDETPVDFGGPPPAGIGIHRIPHGHFELAAPREGREAIRTKFGFSPSDLVFLSFGQIRDGKNLDRFLRAMVQLPPEVKLLVAGSSGGNSQRQPGDYQKLAEELGVADRCVWDIRYIPDEEIGNLFSAADFVLMTYSAKFRSASGVLNIAVSARKPVLASSGPGPLQSAMRDYQLGIFIPPDDDAAILNGAQRILTTLPEPVWERYERENSWQENAKRVIDAFQSFSPE